ncbi:MAG: thioredoxin [Candidatus Dojkabacteria bacterium]|jgi:thioredoxin 1
MSSIRLTDSNFKEEIKDYSGVALVDFWAPWCGPCQMASPIIDELAKEYEGKVKVGKVNVDEEGTLATEYEIMSIPSVFLFKNGEIVETLIGGQSKESYIEAIEKHI